MEDKMSVTTKREKREGEIKLNQENLEKFGKTELFSLAKKLNINVKDSDSKGKIIQALSGSVIKRDSIEPAWIEILEDNPVISEKTVMQKIVTGKKVKIPGTNTSVALKADEKILSYTIHKDRVVMVIEGKRTLYKKTVDR